MKIGVFKERAPGELRVALTPETAKEFSKKNFEVFIEEDAGIAAGFTNDEYKAVGSQIFKASDKVSFDIILKVHLKSYDKNIDELFYLKEEGNIIGLLDLYNNPELPDLYNKKKISVFAVELVPRITRAQSMDVLSSQANLLGYRAVIEAALHIKKIFPMLMTAAGTIKPVKALVLGAGVAGLQAIATAKRLGAIVTATDARPAAKEQVESLGAKFASIETKENFETTSGYAKEVSEDYKRKQQELLASIIVDQDIVITTAQIPGKKAPILLDENMVHSMKRNSVIIDLAAATGGNCMLTQKDKIVSISGVNIIGYTNLISNVAEDASKLYARNLLNIVSHIFGAADKEIDIKDEIVASIAMTHKGQIFKK